MAADPRGILDKKTVIRGDTFKSWWLQFNNTETEELLDIIGAHICVRDYTGKVVHVWDFQSKGNITLTSHGRITMDRVLSTSKWPVGILNYDVQLFLASGEITTLLKGEIDVKRDYSIV